MSAKTANWIIGFGAVLALSATAFLPLGFGENHDSSALSAAAALFSLGALLIGGGFYLKARLLETRYKRDNPAAEPARPAKRKKGTCEVCRQTPSVITCTLHRAQLCATCMTVHYDSRTCVYVPVQRRVGRATAAGARG